MFIILVLVQDVLVVDKGIFIASVKEDGFIQDKTKKLTLSQRLRRWSGVNFQGGDLEFYQTATQKLMNEAADFIEKQIPTAGQICGILDEHNTNLDRAVGVHRFLMDNK